MKKLLTLMMFAMATSLLSSPADAQDQKVRWRLAETWPTNFSLFSEVPRRMAENVKKMSGGRFTIIIDSANKHKSPLGVFDFVSSGQYQMAHSASYYWKGKDINTLFFTTMPLGMIEAEQTGWYYFGGGKELAQKVYGQYGMRYYPGGNTGNQMGGWFKKEINSIEDLQGLQMRIPGFAGEVLAKVGAKPTNIAPGELYTALERGTIDALEWIGPAMDLDMGFQKIAPYYYTGWHEPATELQFLVNEKAFQALPEEFQAILEIAMQEAAFEMAAESYYENAVIWDSIKQDYPEVQVKTFPPEVMSALKTATEELVNEFEAKGGITAEIIKSQREYSKKAREWTNISDKAYLNNLSE
ncbi:MAG: ABC transporter substrate-binding protein [Micavibrio sp.]|nr:ABC transporter substrate-binding protein [Micavibrio sp.]